MHFGIRIPNQSTCLPINYPSPTLTRVHNRFVKNFFFSFPFLFLRQKCIFGSNNRGTRAPLKRPADYLDILGIFSSAILSVIIESTARCVQPARCAHSCVLTQNHSRLSCTRNLKILEIARLGYNQIEYVTPASILSSGSIKNKFFLFAL